MNSDTWFPERLISDRWVSSLFSILLNWKNDDSVARLHFIMQVPLCCGDMHFKWKGTRLQNNVAQLTAKALKGVKTENTASDVRPFIEKPILLKYYYASAEMEQFHWRGPPCCLSCCLSSSSTFSLLLRLIEVADLNLDPPFDLENKLIDVEEYV